VALTCTCKPSDKKHSADNANDDDGWIWSTCQINLGHAGCLLGMSEKEENLDLEWKLAFKKGDFSTQANKKNTLPNPRRWP